MKETWLNWCKRGTSVLGNFRYAALIVGVGMFLMLLPTGERDAEERFEPSSQENVFELEAFEKRLETVLSAVEGAGETRVLLTLDR